MLFREKSGLWYVCVRARVREGGGRRRTGEKGEGGSEAERPRGAADRAGRGAENKTRAVGERERLKTFWGSPINVNMVSVTGAVLKMLLLLSAQNWSRVVAGNSCKYTADDLHLQGGCLQNFNSVVLVIIICN